MTLVKISELENGCLGDTQKDRGVRWAEVDGWKEGQVIFLIFLLPYDNSSTQQCTLYVIKKQNRESCIIQCNEVK